MSTWTWRVTEGINPWVIYPASQYHLLTYVYRRPTLITFTKKRDTSICWNSILYKHIWGIVTGAFASNVPVTIAFGKRNLLEIKKYFQYCQVTYYHYTYTRKKNHTPDAKTIFPKKIIIQQITQAGQISFFFYAFWQCILQTKPISFSTYFGSLAYCK